MLRPPPSDDGGGSNKKTSITLGWNQPFYSYNENTSNGNNVTNSNTKYLTTSSFWYVTADGELAADKSFGTYEKTSDDPLTVKYTVSKDATWSDGTPVDAADLLLDWAAQSGNLNTIAADKVKTDEATGLPKNTKGKVYFDTSSIGLSLVKETPKIGDDGKSLTMTYTKPYADWAYDMSVNLPGPRGGREGPRPHGPAEGQGRARQGGPGQGRGRPGQDLQLLEHGLRLHHDAQGPRPRALRRCLRDQGPQGERVHDVREEPEVQG